MKNYAPLQNLQGKRILLASHSPRRHELLGMLGIDFSVADSIDVDESYPADIPVDTVAEYLSLKKAEAYSLTLKPDTVLITADTIVIVNGEILGKPHTEENAREMLKIIREKAQGHYRRHNIHNRKETFLFRRDKCNLRLSY